MLLTLSIHSWSLQASNCYRSSILLLEHRDRPSTTLKERCLSDGCIEIVHRRLKSKRHSYPQDQIQAPSFRLYLQIRQGCRTLQAGTSDFQRSFQAVYIGRQCSSSGQKFPLCQKYKETTLLQTNLKRLQARPSRRSLPDLTRASKQIRALLLEKSASCP